jgi:hypothetical protein
MKRLAARAILGAAVLAGWATVGAAAEIGQGALGNVFVRGERIVLPLRGAEAGTGWTIKDFFGTEIASGRVGSDGTTAMIEPRIDATGYFTLELGEGQGAAQAALAVVPAPKPVADSPFGVMTHFAKGWELDIVPLIAKAGIRRVRDEQPWRQVEKGRGEFAFPRRLTEYMDALATQKLDPLIVLAFANPHYDGGKTPFTAAGRAGYAGYAAAVARRYAPRVRALEVWNEYNGSFCEGPCRDDRAGAYTAMLKDAYGTLKRQDPSMTVLGGAAVPIPLDWFRRLFENGALGSMDAVVIHPYRKQPEGVEEQIERLRELMGRYGAPKPIWATEFGDVADMRKSRDDVARYLVRMSVLLLAAKVERMYWYLLRDYQDFAGLGLLRDERDPLGRYAPNPAYVAYAVLIDKLSGARFVGRDPAGNDARVYRFTGGAGDIWVAWAAQSTPYSLATSGSVRVATLMGSERVVAPRDGAVSVVLDTNPVYLIRDAARTSAAPTPR